MIEIEGLDEFISKLKKSADGDFKRNMAQWLDAMGMQFLDLIQDEIIRTETVDTRLLLNSFKRGDSNSVFSLSEGGLTLDVGTNVEYASYANDGHAQSKRFIPGYWHGERFVYEPGASSGMMLSAKYVPGSHYWDNALAMFEKMFEKGLDRLLQKYLDENF